MRYIIATDSNTDVRAAEVTEIVSTNGNRSVVRASFLGGPDTGKVSTWNVPNANIYTDDE
jgi:hypothetical protein